MTITAIRQSDAEVQVEQKQNVYTFGTKGDTDTFLSRVSTLRCGYLRRRLQGAARAAFRAIRYAEG